MINFLISLSEGYKPTKLKSKALWYIKQKLIQLQEELDKPTFTARGFTSQLKRIQAMHNMFLNRKITLETNNKNVCEKFLNTVLFLKTKLICCYMNADS